MTKPYKTAFMMYSQGNFDAARGTLEAQLRSKPGDADALFLLGVLDLEAGAMEPGARRLEDAAEKIKPTAQLAHRAGRLFFNHKDYPRAEKWLKAAIEADVGAAASHFWLGNTLRMKGDLRGAEYHLQTSINLKPDQARGYVSLAYHFRDLGQLDRAAEVMMDLHYKGPKIAEGQERVAGFLMEIHRPDLAEKVLSKVLPEKREDAQFLIGLGRIRQQLGMFHEAAQVYRRAIIADPSADAAYLGLSVVKKFENLEDPDAVIMREGLKGEGVSEEARACCRFALGKVHDDCQDYRTAFQHYKEGNDLRAHKNTFDPKAFAKELSAIKNVFSKTYFSNLGRRMPYSKTPVFVVGMLRSGTTLVEQMLNMHPKIFGAGELPFMPTLAREMGKEAGLSEPWPDYVPKLSPELYSGAGAYYLKAISEMSQGEDYLVDKYPMNFLYLGLVATLFPGARIIHCKRHPLDTSLSIFCQNFAHSDMAYSFKLEHIGEVYKGYRDLMEHWYEALPLDIFDLDYESLVKFPERVSRRLIDWLGAGWDDAVLDFQDQGGAVNTASLWQVRQPLYHSSIERWKHYEPELNELKKAFVKANIM